MGFKSIPNASQAPGGKENPYLKTRVIEVSALEGGGVYALGEKIVLRYRVLVHPGRWDGGRLNLEHEKFARKAG